MVSSVSMLMNVLPVSTTAMSVRTVQIQLDLTSATAERDSLEMEHIAIVRRFYKH